ncbi:uncharacterized protein TRIADDRAFT_30960 [Trichoplax adhaerens]|uniref:JmjC domain-containing protein n=1 Tax=Trichoplax adhaerens TaxID=10228 RepID=B3S8A3_TRIAD|nr:hypothetical protein TRIADDRAFT_30960 [Trichoplax adhaerens]EDV21066.1 hypothetical protein TRIADDRAFT_30960 [Trichoplax adhaerens]|eukprot:XP_002116396.1 hypothetical protein TRIADDRAFT_30960 [Trichoplax adhaerens]
MVVHQVEKINGDINHQKFIQDIYPQRKPFLISGHDLGPCMHKWNADYLADVGGQQMVKLHVATQDKMNFITKNFSYKTLPFKEFIRRASATENQHYFFQPKEKYYLRSLGNDPRKEIANFMEQFPALVDDINLPQYYESSAFFSSVLRISSGNLQIWTHYDVMDNTLIQITGRKRVVLFSPQDASNLYLQGDKSAIVDIDNPDLQKYPKFASVTRYECVLEPGDILFIPAMWFHNCGALDFSIGINVFWRHLDYSYYDSRDTYGNKDLLPAARANQILDRAIKALGELPDDYKDFYARRLVSKIENLCYLK